MFVKLALSFEPFNKSWVESRNLGVWWQRHCRKDKHAQRFPFRVHYSAVPGEPELRGGVNSYGVRKNTLTETYPSSERWHLHLNLLFLKDVGGESSSLYEPAFTGCGNVHGAFAVKIFHYDIFNLKEANISCSFEKLSGVFCGLISDIWEVIHNTNAKCCYSICCRGRKLRFGGGSLLIYPKPIF